jgi:hypothetical protein
MFGPKREEETRGWSKFHGKDLHNLYLSQNIRVIKFKRMRWMGPERDEKCIKILVGISEEKRPF